MVICDILVLVPSLYYDPNNKQNVRKWKQTVLPSDKTKIITTKPDRNWRRAISALPTSYLSPTLNIPYLMLSSTHSVNPSIKTESLLFSSLEINSKVTRLSIKSNMFFLLFICQEHVLLSWSFCFPCRLHVTQEHYYGVLFGVLGVLLLYDILY